MSQITCPEFTHLHPEIIGDFKSCLVETVDEIEYCIYKLDSSEDPELVHELFRSMHSLKGNCRMVLLLPFVNTTHELEELVSEIREGTRQYHRFYGSFFTSVISILEKQIQLLIDTGECSKHIVDSINKQIKRLRTVDLSAKGDDLVVVESVLNSLLKIQELPTKKELPVTPPEKSDLNADTKPPRQTTEVLAHKKNNLAFFKSLAEKLDNLSIYRRDRTKEIMKLAHAVNEDLALPVDPDQLSAAIYLHDFGMIFVPSAILNKHESLNKEEVSLIRKHIITGCQLLLNIEGWQTAAEIVMQHHERFDGKGYPEGLKAHDIHPGASIVALADTYCAVTNERSDRSYKRSLFSAVTLINNESGSQFPPDFVESFNDVVRRLYINPANEN
jgi:two-component system, response regulator RpfG